MGIKLKRLVLLTFEKLKIGKWFNNFGNYKNQLQLFFFPSQPFSALSLSPRTEHVFALFGAKTSPSSLSVLDRFLHQFFWFDRSIKEKEMILLQDLCASTLLEAS